MIRNLALVVAVACFAFGAYLAWRALRTLPSEDDLYRYLGRITRWSEEHEGGHHGQHRLTFEVEGFEGRIEHHHGMPGYAALVSAFRADPVMEVAVAPALHDTGHAHAWIVRAQGRTLLAYDDMAAWQREERRKGVMVALLVGVGIPLLLWVLWLFVSRRAAAEPARVA